jgi:hypothetical protein
MAVDAMGGGNPPCCGGYDPSEDPLLMAELVYTAVATPLEGLYNAAIGINNLWRSDETEANIIRGLLIDKYGFSSNDAFGIADSELLDNLEVSMSFFGEKGYYLDSRGGVLEETLEGLVGGLQIASAFAGGGPTGSLFAKTPMKQLSVNQLNQMVLKNNGSIPSGIKRFDKGRGTLNLPQDEVHFTNGASLYRDGTWRHQIEGFKVSNKQKDFLQTQGWNVEGL